MWPLSYRLRNLGISRSVRVMKIESTGGGGSFMRLVMAVCCPPCVGFRVVSMTRRSGCLKTVELQEHCNMCAEREKWFG